MRLTLHGQLVALDQVQRSLIGSVRHGGDQPTRPVEGVGGDRSGSGIQVVGCRINISIERHHGVEGIGRESQPHDSLCGVWHVGANLDEAQEVVPVDADGPVGPGH